MDFFKQIKNAFSILKEGQTDISAPNVTIKLLEANISDQEQKLLTLYGKKKENLEKEIEENKKVLAYLQKKQYLKIERCGSDEINNWVKENKKWLTSSGFWIEKKQSKNGIVINVSFLNFEKKFEADAPTLEITTEQLSDDLASAFGDKNKILVSVE